MESSSSYAITTPISDAGITATQPSPSVEHPLSADFLASTMRTRGHGASPAYSADRALPWYSAKGHNRMYSLSRRTMIGSLMAMGRRSLLSCLLQCRTRRRLHSLDRSVRWTGSPERIDRHCWHSLHRNGMLATKSSVSLALLNAMLLPMRSG